MRAPLPGPSVLSHSFPPRSAKPTWTGRYNECGQAKRDDFGKNIFNNLPFGMNDNFHVAIVRERRHTSLKKCRQMAQPSMVVAVTFRMCFPAFTYAFLWTW